MAEKHLVLGLVSDSASVAAEALSKVAGQVKGGAEAGDIVDADDERIGSWRFRAPTEDE